MASIELGQPAGAQPEGAQPGIPDAVIEPLRTRLTIRRGSLRRYFLIRPSTMSEEGEHLAESIVKDPGSTHSVELDLYVLIAKEWQPNREYNVGDVVRPIDPNGYAIEATVAGTSAETRPRVPAAIDEPFTDGSVTWKVIAAGSNSLLSVGSPQAQSAPAGLTISGVAIRANRYLQATYSSGLLGSDFDAVFTVDIGGEPKVFRQTVKIREQ